MPTRATSFVRSEIRCSVFSAEPELVAGLVARHLVDERGVERDRAVAKGGIAAEDESPFDIAEPAQKFAILLIPVRDVSGDGTELEPLAPDRAQANVVEAAELDALPKALERRGLLVGRVGEFRNDDREADDVVLVRPFVFRLTRAAPPTVRDLSLSTSGVA